MIITIMLRGKSDKTEYIRACMHRRTRVSEKGRQIDWKEEKRQTKKQTGKERENKIK